MARSRVKPTTRSLEYLPLAGVKAAKVNPKDHDLPALRESIERFGYLEPGVLDERTGRLVGGHGRHDDLAAAEAAGLDPPEGVQVADDGTWLVPVVRGWASRNDREAHAAGVALNRSTEAGGWHYDVLAEVLGDLRDHDALAGTGFTDTAVDDLLAAHAPPPDLGALAGSLGEPDPADFWPTITVKVPPDVHAAWSDLVAAHDGAEAVAMAALLLPEG